MNDCKGPENITCTIPQSALAVFIPETINEFCNAYIYIIYIYTYIYTQKKQPQSQSTVPSMHRKKNLLTLIGYVGV